MSPAELVELGRQIATQDGQCTAHPMFLVQQRKRIYGLDSRWGGETVWLVNRPVRASGALRP